MGAEHKGVIYLHTYEVNFTHKIRKIGFQVVKQNRIEKYPFKEYEKT